ncbi:hypothetical protein BJY01DRAFT_252342 [Aspergillus pseudoustus]|uniref:Extracellular membrane protein CFEM domain-containing protein n=1 Tax=Aspergillus pseudoustus TaxID=1810923 RepID=A0ABR4J704_9EURO
MHFTTISLPALAILLSAPLISAEDSDFELPQCISACIKENALSFDPCSDATIVGPSEQACVCGIVQFSAQCDCVDECSLEDIAVYAATIPGWCRYEFASALTDEELETANEESLSDEDWTSFLDGPSVVELNNDVLNGGESESDSETDSETETPADDSDDQSVDDDEQEEDETTDDTTTEDTTSEDDTTDSADKDAAAGLAVPSFALASALLLALLF